MNESVARAAQGLAERFRRRAERFVVSPYRICPLGAHVDHQDGVVTGMAIDQGVVVAFAPRDDPLVRAASADFPGEVRFDVHAVPPAQPDTMYVPYYEPATVYGEWPYADYPPYYFGYPSYIGAGAVVKSGSGEAGLLSEAATASSCV